MCKNCKIVEQTFQAAGAEPHLNFVPVLPAIADSRMLLRFWLQKSITRFAFMCSVNPAGRYSFWERAFAGYQNTAK